mmetsp:Transcript_6110/g.11162  ORF Transcript_6110/g.11162 Transcript_6110/m.11162 type:complete len:84 (-) Transcript_6110:51-302(-)
MPFFGNNGHCLSRTPRLPPPPPAPLPRASPRVIPLEIEWKKSLRNLSHPFFLTAATNKKHTHNNKKEKQNLRTKQNHTRQDEI